MAETQRGDQDPPQRHQGRPRRRQQLPARLLSRGGGLRPARPAPTRRRSGDGSSR